MILRRFFFHSICLIAAVAISGCTKPPETANAGSTSQAMPVKILAIQEQTVPEFTDYLASLKSRNASALQPQVEGAITHIFTQSGQRVEQGAPILEIDPTKQEATVSNQEAAYKSKQATLELNRTELERRKNLFSAGVISRADLDVAQSAYDASKADLDALGANIREQRVQLHYYTVKAPTSGIVGDIPVHVGDHVTSQTVLTTLDRGGELEAYLYIPADKSRSVRLGLPVELVDDTGKSLGRSQVSFVSPQVETASQTVLLKAPIPNLARQFRNDQTVHARLIWSEHKAALIPVTAVSRLSGRTFAFVAEGSGSATVAKQRVILLGDLIGNDYVVLDGLKQGDRVITSGIQLLSDGAPVIPQT